MSRMYTPRNADSPTTTTRRACMALCRMSFAAKRHAMTAANISARNSAAAAIMRRCRKPREEATKPSATASARQASNGVTIHGYQVFSQPIEYGWYESSKQTDAQVASANNGSFRPNPVRQSCTRQTTIESKYTRSTCPL